jgi:hypothetical protein
MVQEHPKQALDFGRKGLLKSSLFSNVMQRRVVDGNGRLGTTFGPKTWTV